MTTWPIVLLLAAAALMMFEVIIPSFGMLGLLSATSYVFAVVLAWKVSPTDGLIVAGAGMLILPAAFLLGMRLVRKTPFGKKTLLDGPAPSTIQRGFSEGMRMLHGRTGVAATDLRPSGKAEIDGLRVDVTAAAEFVPKNTPLTVLHVEGTRIVVAPTPPKEGTSPS